MNDEHKMAESVLFEIYLFIARNSGYQSIQCYFRSTCM